MDVKMEEINSKIDALLVGGTGGFEFIRVDALAEKLGCAEVALRFLLGVFAGYPFAFLYLLLSKSLYNRKHLFFTITGLLICYFCFGSDSIYVLFSIFVTYLSIMLFGGTIQNVIFAFLFHTSYLTVGYLKNASDGYDVKWTTPQCILCLRLIGLAWDLYDGQQKEESLSPYQLQNRVVKKPTLMEVCGYSYCFCGFLGGPQYSFNRYIKFVSSNLYETDAVPKGPSRFYESLKRFLGAICILGVFIQLDPYYRCDDLLKNSFQEIPFLSKLLQMALIYYVQFSKYVVIWWFCESICMLIGLSYNGVDDNGCAKWDGLRNFKFRQFIFGTFFQDIIDSFNINTNQWAGRYLFRRLRFLGNKTASHVLTLLYLAIWHGFYVGYFIMFLLEFIAVTIEGQVCSVCRSIFGTSFADLSLSVRIPVQMAGALFKFIFCGFAVQSFMLLRWRRIKVAYDAVYYWPVVLMGTWFFCVGPLLSTVAKKQKTEHAEKKVE